MTGTVAAYKSPLHQMTSTTRQFIAACHELDGQIREVLIPNPDEAKVTA